MISYDNIEVTFGDRVVLQDRNRRPLKAEVAPTLHRNNDLTAALGADPIARATLQDSARAVDAFRIPVTERQAITQQRRANLVHRHQGQRRSTRPR